MTHDLSPLRSRGVHLAFTGIDGAGKSTQAGYLALHMSTKYGPTYFAEPRTDLVSKLLHRLAWQHGQTSRRKYFGDHVVDFSKSFDVVRDHFSTLEPLLIAGMHVVEPRSVPCRTAMALAMSGTRDEKTEQVLSLIPKPDLLFWIDTDPELALERVKRRGIDSENLHDLQLFHAAYHQMPESSNWVRIDGNQSENEVAEQVRCHVDRFLSR